MGAIKASVQKLPNQKIINTKHHKLRATCKEVFITLFSVIVCLHLTLVVGQAICEYKTFCTFFSLHCKINKTSVHSKTLSIYKEML